MIPNIFHFVFGMAADFGGKPFSISHYLAIKSAVELNRPDTVYFHYQYEPGGKWWEAAKPLMQLNQITAPETFMGRSIYHVAHKADVVRLQVLQQSGGIYLDLDTICIQPFTALLQHSFVMGEELPVPYNPKNWRQRIKYKLKQSTGMTNGKIKPAGLCNAVLLAEKNNAFINLWLDEYKSFRSTGRDKYWNEHSVTVPERLAEIFPQLITRLGPELFYYPLYDKQGLQSLFETTAAFPKAMLFHLWESFSWDQYLSVLSEEVIRTTDTTYNLIARKFLNSK